MPKPYFYILAAMGFMISACEKNPKTVQEDNFAIQAPQLVSQKTQSQVSFKELTSRRVEKLYSSDVILFANGFAASLHTKSFCYSSENKVESSLKFDLPSELQISEILPPITRLYEGWKCDFEFTAINSNGSEHYFELEQYEVEDDAEAQIRVTKDPLSQMELTRVLSHESAQTYLILPQKSHVRVQCEAQILEADPDNSYLSFFELRLREGEIPTDRALRCRALALSEDGRTKALSKVFWRLPQTTKLEVFDANPPRLTVEYLRHPRVKTLQIWRIENQGDHNALLRIPKNHVPLPIEVQTGLPGDTYIETFEWPTYVEVHSKDVELIGNDYHLQLRPNDSVNVSLMSGVNFDCVNTDSGFYVPDTQDKPLIVDSIFAVNDSSPGNTIESLKLVNHGPTWVGITEQNIGRKAHGDGVSGLPAESVQHRRNHHCRFR